MGRDRAPGRGVLNPSAYHHGDLAAAVLDEATRHVGSGGAESLGLRAVAAAVGVSHTALYRHYAGRDDLLNAVAAAWLDRLTASLPLTGPAELVQGYVTGALAEPHLYRCAFDQAARPDADRARAALARLRDRAAAAFAAGTGTRGEALRDDVLRTWSTVHGMLDLYWRGLVRARSAKEAGAYIVRAVRH